MKALETPNMPAVGSLSFCTKQQSGNADCLVDRHFGEGTEIFINKDSRSEKARFMCAWISLSMRQVGVRMLPR